MTSVAASPLAPVHRPARDAGPFAGTGTLLRFALRRDRILLPAWVAGLAATVALSVTSTADLYPSVGSRAEAAETINATAALVALYGRIYDVTSLGALSLIKLTAFGAAVVGIVFAMLVVRHTRTDEEAGRLELLASGAVGRSAPLAAALLLAGVGSVALGTVTTACLFAVGMPVAGSAAFGLSWALAAAVFAAVGGVAAQLFASHRAATGMSLVVVGTSYLLRAVGDLSSGGPGWPAWLSPVAWSQQVRPFAGDRWVVALVPLAATALLTTAAFALRSRRDLGAGLLADRPGPAHGRLTGPTALAWRVQRGAALAWLLGAVTMGAVLGSIAQDVTGLLDSAQMRSYLVALGGEQGLVDAFLAAEISILGTVIAAFGIVAALRLRAEEADGHAEPVLSADVGRTRLAAGHLAIAFAGVAVILVAASLAVGVAHAVDVSDASQVGRLAAAGAAHVPAAWVLIGLCAVLFGWLPRAMAATAWTVFAACVVVGELGALWRLPSWLQDLSPFAHSPTLPGGRVDLWSLAWLGAVAALLTVAGLAGWRQRDLAA